MEGLRVLEEEEHPRADHAAQEQPARQLVDGVRLDLLAPAPPDGHRQRGEARGEDEHPVAVDPEAQARDDEQDRPHGVFPSRARPLGRLAPSIARESAEAPARRPEEPGSARKIDARTARAGCQGHAGFRQADSGMSAEDCHSGSPPCPIAAATWGRPRDAEAFGEHRAIRPCGPASADLCWLLGHGYATVSSLKLVGDRWDLTERQRMAVRRSACSDEDRARRASPRLSTRRARGRELWVNGFNVLTTIEAFLGGGVVIHCRDGTFRDLAGVHGTYRRVVETTPALEPLAGHLEGLRVGRVRWLFDRPCLEQRPDPRPSSSRSPASVALRWTV